MKNLQDYCGSLTSSDNANSLTKTGFYYITSSVPTNVPSDFTWSILFQYTPVSATNMIHQYLFKPVYNRLMFREYSGSPSSWTVWKEASHCSGISWGSSFTIECDRNVCEICVNNDLKIQVYLGASSDILVGVTAITNSGIVCFTKSSSTGSITFSGTSASGTDFTISRNGKTVTVTKSGNAAMIAYA